MSPMPETVLPNLDSARMAVEILKPTLAAILALTPLPVLIGKAGKVPAALP